jgi:hypothetical protein
MAACATSYQQKNLLFTTQSLAVVQQLGLHVELIF